MSDTKYPLIEAMGLTIVPMYYSGEQFINYIKADDLERALEQAPVVDHHPLHGPNGKARLVCIQPIVKDTAEQILRDLIAEYDIAHNVPGTGLGYRKFYDRARKLLSEGEK